MACIKKAFKEDIRYAGRWMIFLEPLGLGAKPSRGSCE